MHTCEHNARVHLRAYVNNSFVLPRARHGIVHRVHVSILVDICLRALVCLFGEVCTFPVYDLVPVHKYMLSVYTCAIVIKDCACAKVHEMWDNLTV